MAILQAGFTDEIIFLTQTFSTSGGLFSGDAAFLGEDLLPWNDAGFVRLYRLPLGDDPLPVLPDDPANLFYEDIAGVGDYGFTDWKHFSIRLAPGDYRVEIGVVDNQDDREPSVLLVDNFSLSVPEPGAWALMLTGFFGLGVALRRRRAALA